MRGEEDFTLDPLLTLDLFWPLKLAELLSFRFFLLL